jgi:hypothetical protein
MVQTDLIGEPRNNLTELSIGADIVIDTVGGKDQLDAIALQRRWLSGPVFPERGSSRAGELASGPARPIQLGDAPLRTKARCAHRQVEPTAGRARAASLGLGRPINAGAAQSSSGRQRGNPICPKSTVEKR